jgi:SAM-dependent methyltransferase
MPKLPPECYGGKTGGNGMNPWIDFWNRPNAIYANQRNLDVHFQYLIRDLQPYLPSGGYVLDYGCGDALAAEAMAAHCERLYLYDAAPAVRERLRQRFQDHPVIVVLDDQGLRDLAPGSLDLIVVVSVIQYISRDDLLRTMAAWRALLKPDGRLLVADVIDPATPLLRDVSSQLRLAWRHGFLMAALGGLVRMFRSDYRTIRHKAGFSVYRPEEMLDLLHRTGFEGEILPHNIGPTPHRRSFLARRNADRKAEDQKAGIPIGSMI